MWYIITTSSKCTTNLLWIQPCYCSHYDNNIVTSLVNVSLPAFTRHCQIVEVYMSSYLSLFACKCNIMSKSHQKICGKYKTKTKTKKINMHGLASYSYNHGITT